jgi:hypothetical protein
MVVRKFRALYAVEHLGEKEEAARGTLLMGVGPPRVRADMMEEFFTYDSVLKQFVLEHGGKDHSMLAHEDASIHSPGNLDGTHDAFTLRPKKAVQPSRSAPLLAPSTVNGGARRASLGSSETSMKWAAHRTYTGGQVGWSTSATDVAGR